MSAPIALALNDGYQYKLTPKPVRQRKISSKYNKVQNNDHKLEGRKMLVYYM